MKINGSIKRIAAASLVAQLHRVPFANKIRRWIVQITQSGPIQFTLVFVLFVLVSAGAEVFLEGSQTGSRFGDFFQALWFTVVTITTVGYGDMSPTTPMAQTWAMVEMLVGIGLVGVITGNIASALVERNRKRALGLVPVKGLRGHTVICGWKQDISQILIGILDANPNLTSGDLVLVTKHFAAEVGELRRDKRLRRLKFIYGSHTNRDVLEMALVQRSSRVIILAEESEGVDRDEIDSRTVLAATTVETLSDVYTCTELLQPHFTPYLKQARVEEVVLGQENRRALLTAASLADGLSNVVARFFPENGNVLRVFPIPKELKGARYGDLALRFQELGLLTVGLLNNTGNLHDRKKEKLRSAMIQPPEYEKAIKILQDVKALESNRPEFAPPLEKRLPDHALVLALDIPPLIQSEGDMTRRSQQVPLKRSDLVVGLSAKEDKTLVICGWKNNMAGLLHQMINTHKTMKRPLGQITVIGRLPHKETEAIAEDSKLKMVKICYGEPTDPDMLRKGGIKTAGRVLIVADGNAEHHDLEADARNVMISIAVDAINPRAYKCVELFNASFQDHLRRANVEEIVFTRRYQQMMLVQAAQATGLAHAIHELLDPEHSLLRVVDFPPAPPGADFAHYQEAFSGMGMILIGLVDRSGNLHARKHEYLHDAQVQPNIVNAIDHLHSLKNIVSNEAILNPGESFLPGTFGRAVVLVPNVKGNHHGS